NRDGMLVLAVTNRVHEGTVSVLLGNGDGTFQAALTSSTGGPEPFSGRYPLSVAAGDFNGDGKLDLAVANGSSDNVAVLLGNGDGTFQTARTLAVGTVPLSVAAGDFNGDGKLDLAVTNRYSNTVSVLVGNGDGTFPTAPPSRLALLLAPWSRATSMPTGSKTWPWPTRAVGCVTRNAVMLVAASPCDWAGAMEPSRLPWNSISLLMVDPSHWPRATSTATASSTSRSPTAMSTTSRCCSATATGLSSWHATAALASIPFQSPWATSTAMGCRSWRWPTERASRCGL